MEAISERGHSVITRLLNHDEFMNGIRFFDVHKLNAKRVDITVQVHNRNQLLLQYSLNKHTYESHHAALCHLVVLTILALVDAILDKDLDKLRR